MLAGCVESREVHTEVEGDGGAKAALEDAEADAADDEACHVVAGAHEG